MKLTDYMREHHLDDTAMAERIGNCTAHAVKKWKYGEREPSVAALMRIEQVTDGAVTTRDFLTVLEDRKRRGAA